METQERPEARTQQAGAPPVSERRAEPSAEGPSWKVWRVDPAPTIAPTDDRPAMESAQSAPPATAVPPRGKEQQTLAALPPPAQIVPPESRGPAARGPEAQGKPRIAILLDDVGVVRRNAELAATLDAPVTLAFMTYAPDVAAQAAAARTRGHEIMLHLPMEPLSRSENPGPNALVLGLDPAELDRRIDWALSRFDFFVGVNNHMGSRFTADRPGMARVMEALKTKGVFFVDSRTTAQTVAGDEAKRHGVPSLNRDVFLDNDLGAGQIDAQLAEAERKARAQGHALAIGHPHPETIAALKRWIPEARARGIELVAVSALVGTGLTE